MHSTQCFNEAAVHHGGKPTASIDLTGGIHSASAHRRSQLSHPNCTPRANWRLLSDNRALDKPDAALQVRPPPPLSPPRRANVQALAAAGMPGCGDRSEHAASEIRK